MDYNPAVLLLFHLMPFVSLEVLRGSGGIAGNETRSKRTRDKLTWSHDSGVVSLNLIRTVELCIKHGLTANDYNCDY